MLLLLLTPFVLVVVLLRFATVHAIICQRFRKNRNTRQSPACSVATRMSTSLASLHAGLQHSLSASCIARTLSSRDLPMLALELTTFHTLLGGACLKALIAGLAVLGNLNRFWLVDLAYSVLVIC